MGLQAKTTFEINASGLDLNLLIVRRQNHKLKATLEQHKQRKPRLHARERTGNLKAARTIAKTIGKMLGLQ